MEDHNLMECQTGWEAYWGDLLFVWIAPCHERTIKEYNYKYELKMVEETIESAWGNTTIRAHGAMEDE